MGGSSGSASVRGAPSAPVDIRRLGPADSGCMEAMSAMFGDAFDDPPTYTDKRPGPEYLRRLLASDTFVALVATQAGVVVGGLVAYVLPKYEQARSEVYLYDLAVAATHRRRGIATALIGRLVDVARTLGAYVVFVQADYIDQPAIALYTKLGVREDVLHFDIAVPREPDAPGGSPGPQAQSAAAGDGSR